MAPLKLLFYTYSLVDGGAERVWATLASEFARRGHDVLFVIDYGHDHEPIQLHPAVRRATLGGNHGTTVRRLAAILRDETPDVALGAVAGSDLKLVLARTLARVDTRLIISFHGMMEPETGWLSWLTHVSVPILSRVADRTVCVSEGMKTHLETRWRSAPARTVCVYNPVEYPTRSTPLTRRALAARDNVVVAMGRLVPEKCYDSLIRAFAGVKTPDARLVILGEGSDRARIQAEIDRLGLGARVSLPGFRKDVWADLDRAKCFAHTAKSEAFGLVIAEALAAGLPVVATLSPGPHEILVDADRQFGTLVPPDDEAAMAAAIDAALADPGDPAPRVARAGEFSSAIGVDAYSSMIDDVLAERRPVRAAAPEPRSAI